MTQGEWKQKEGTALDGDWIVWSPVTSGCDVPEDAATAEQPAPKRGTHKAMHSLVVSDLIRRADTGRQKYGTYLKAWNGRDALVDAYQEVLDLSCYLRQEIEERTGAKTIEQGLIDQAIELYDENKDLNQRLDDLGVASCEWQRLAEETKDLFLKQQDALIQTTAKLRLAEKETDYWKTLVGFDPERAGRDSDQIADIERAYEELWNQ